MGYELRISDVASDTGQNVILVVLAGTFATQPEAFDALNDAALNRGVRVGAWEVDVIREATHVRLAHYFRPAIVARIEEMRGADDTVVIVKPSTLAVAPMFPGDDSGFRLLGRFAGVLES